MLIAATSMLSLTPQALAESLADASPEDFAAFWLAFDGLTADNVEGEKKLRAFAEAMAPFHGGNRKRPLRNLARLIEYYEQRDAIEGRRG
jgi:hypothetical protein